MESKPHEDKPTDYLGREVCRNCGHTKAMHTDTKSPCAVMHCYCMEYKE